MKTWIKKHWKNILVISIVIAVFGTGAIINMNITSHNRELHKGNLEKLRYIGMKVSEGLQPCPVCKSCKSYDKLCKPTKEECIGYCTKLIEWSKKCNHPVITEKECWNTYYSYYSHRPYDEVSALDCWEASLWFSNGNCKEIPPRPGAKK